MENIVMLAGLLKLDYKKGLECFPLEMCNVELVTFCVGSRDMCMLIGGEHSSIG